jgi:hypothetical protein
MEINNTLGFGINPDYVHSHPRWMYKEEIREIRVHNPRIWPQLSPTSLPRANTPPYVPEELPLQAGGRRYPASFLQKHWKALAGIIMRYHHVSDGTKAKKERNCRVRVLANGNGFDVEYMASLPASRVRKWSPIEIKDLLPVHAGCNNHQWLWVIVDGEDAGKYCKALSAPRKGEEEGQPCARVLLAHLEDHNGREVTLIDTPQQERHIPLSNLMVVWQTPERRKDEPDVYIRRGEEDGLSGLERPKGKKRTPNDPAVGPSQATKRKRPN